MGTFTCGSRPSLCLDVGQSKGESSHGVAACDSLGSLQNLLTAPALGTDRSHRVDLFILQCCLWWRGALFSLVLIVVMGSLQIRAARAKCWEESPLCTEGPFVSVMVTQLRVEPQPAKVDFLFPFFKREEWTEEKAWEFDCTFLFPWPSLSCGLNILLAWDVLRRPP